MIPIKLLPKQGCYRPFNARGDCVYLRRRLIAHCVGYYCEGDAEFIAKVLNDKFGAPPLPSRNPKIKLAALRKREAQLEAQLMGMRAAIESLDPELTKLNTKPNKLHK